jgi:hypothetical protein
MNFGKVKYQCVLFGDFKEFFPSTERIMTLLEIYKDKKLIPITFSEYIIPNPNLVNRIAFSSENNEWQFKIGSSRLEIFHNSLNLLGDNLGSIQSFVEESLDILNRFLGKYEKKGNRLSLLGEFFLDDDDKAKYDNFYLRFRKPHNLYKENIPFEWIIRDATRKIIKEEEEKKEYIETFNIITEINRSQGQIILNNQLKPVDRINVFLDLNSIPENLDTRFDSARITWGLNKAVSYFSSLSIEIVNMQG